MKTKIPVEVVLALTFSVAAIAVVITVKPKHNPVRGTLHFVSKEKPAPKPPEPTPKKPKKKRLMVAVIDTGLDPELMHETWVCPTGHKDFTGNGLQDDHGHGTHVSGIIDQYAKNYIFKEVLKKNKSPKDIDNVNVSYCQIILKYYDPDADGVDNLANTIKALKWAIARHVDIINYSGGGVMKSRAEEKAIKEALDAGIKVVAAAGNEKANIDVYHYYPASYDKRIYVVGNGHSDLDRAPTSNHGKGVNDWEVGNDVLSRLPGQSFGNMTGTSQAAAVKSGKLVREMLLSQ